MPIVTGHNGQHTYISTCYIYILYMNYNTCIIMITKTPMPPVVQVAEGVIPPRASGIFASLDTVLLVFACH